MSRSGLLARAGDKAGELDPLFLQALLAARQPDGQDGERMLMQVLRTIGGGPFAARADRERSRQFVCRPEKQSAQADLWYRKSIRTYEDQRAAVKDEELRLPFFANGDTLYRDYAEFLISSQKQEKALQLLDIGRARTLAEGLGSVTEAGPKPEISGRRPGPLLANSMPPFCFYSLGTEKILLMGSYANRTHLFLLPGQSELRPRSRDIRRPF